MGKHVKKWDRCFDKLKKEKGESGAAAICSSSIDNAGLKAKEQKRDKKDYYANKKKADKVNDNNNYDVIENIVQRFNDFTMNETDNFSGGGAYTGPNITNKIAGQLVGSGSDGKLGVNQTEIEGGDDGVTGLGDPEEKYKPIVKYEISRQSRRRKNAEKKMAKVSMMSFSDFSNKKDEENDN